VAALCSVTVIGRGDEPGPNSGGVWARLLSNGCFWRKADNHGGPCSEGEQKCTTEPSVSKLAPKLAKRLGVARKSADEGVEDLGTLDSRFCGLTES
jgi:hypothetical protein